MANYEHIFEIVSLNIASLLAQRTHIVSEEDERGPEAGMAEHFLTFPHQFHGVTKGFTCALSVPQAFVEYTNHRICDNVVHRPQRDENRASSSCEERTCHADHTLSLDFAPGAVTWTENNQLSLDSFTFKVGHLEHNFIHGDGLVVTSPSRSGKQDLTPLCIPMSRNVNQIGAFHISKERIFGGRSSCERFAVQNFTNQLRFLHGAGYPRNRNDLAIPENRADVWVSNYQGFACWVPWPLADGVCRCQRWDESYSHARLRHVSPIFIDEGSKRNKSEGTVRDDNDYLWVCNIMPYRVEKKFVQECQQRMRHFSKCWDFGSSVILICLVCHQFGYSSLLQLLYTGRIRAVVSSR